MTAHRRLSCLALFALAVCNAAWADISYSVTAAEGKRLSVEMRFDAKGPVRIQMPNWAPGAYVLGVPANNVQDFAVMDGAGKAVPFTKENPNTWSLDQSPDRKVVVKYTTPFSMNSGAANYNGPGVYMYVVDRKTEKCKLTVNVPNGWKIATGLDPVGGKGADFVAPDYDVLADSPVTVGAIRELRYKVKGIDHLIALYGPAKDEVDEQKIVKACKFVTEIETDFMRSIPYKRYVWHFSTTDRYDGAGGLEHLNSTQIGLSAGVGPRAVGVLAHEFFHLWNVKRIRSKPLGPFDYNVLPKTGALWWLEGVTDYYAHSLLHRYGWWDTDYFYRDILGNMRSQRSKPGRMSVSPYQASFRVGDANGGRGNSDGYMVSYYDTGWLVGMCLDIEILAQSKGKYRLDDVERALWELCKDGKPGFEEDEIRKQCVRFGGPSLGGYYDKIVMQAGELPIEAALEKVGLTLANERRTDADLLVNLTPSREAKALATRGARGAAEALFKDGDFVVEIDGFPTTGDTIAGMTQKLMDITGKLKPNQTVKMKVRRGSETIEVSYELGANSVDSPTITNRPSTISPEQMRLRDVWMFAGKKKG